MGRPRIRVIPLVIFWILATFSPIAAAATSLFASPATVDLGNIQNPLGAKPVEVTLTNNGTTDVLFGWSLPLGTSYPSFPCFANGSATFVIHPGQSCLFGVKVTISDIAEPGVFGPGTTILEISVNNAEFVVPITLTWDAVPLALAVDTQDVAFGDVQVGAPPAMATRVVRNNSSQPIDVAQSIQGGAGPDCSGRVESSLCATEIQQVQDSFVVTGDGCHPISPSGACTLSIAFAPREAFAMSSSIQVTGPPGSDAIAQTILVMGTGIAPQTTPGTTLAVEYFNSPLGHFFMTADKNEEALLDAGHFGGWKRTGRSFWVFPPAVHPIDSSPVCRFYGRPEAGLDSHFYSASTHECGEVLARFPGEWVLESNEVFDVFLPDATTGSCRPNSTPVYRLYNQRADGNHRYTHSVDVRSEMLFEGWIAEGYGPFGVAMCSPQ